MIEFRLVAYVLVWVWLTPESNGFAAALLTGTVITWDYMFTGSAEENRER